MTRVTGSNDDRTRIILGAIEPAIELLTVEILSPVARRFNYDLACQSEHLNCLEDRRYPLDRNIFIVWPRRLLLY